METINRVLSTLGFFAFTLLLLAANVLFGIYIISLMIVPLTWFWAKVKDQSYESLCDTSNMLYKLNKFGQWAWLLTGAVLITYFCLFAISR
jgi:hypothetical protein